ncbi:hypothetical protein COB57_03730 [Candidatus Peregrinibacteria bacterium]|nr:MAG: hypothetical protein COB57_03730 [Candidatus Peregrinibacteria bacterium]
MNIEMHKTAKKQLIKAPKIIKIKVSQLVQHIFIHGLKNCPFPIKPMKGKYNTYSEFLIHKDYRIIYRTSTNTLYIRYAGTHNELGTG